MFKHFKHFRHFKHLLGIRDLTPEQVEALLKLGQDFLREDGGLALPILKAEPLKHVVVASLFEEPSTRTRLSFQIAASKLGACTIEINLSQSSIQKGETLLDTVETLIAMGCRHWIMRHPQPGAIYALASELDPVRPLSLINAGNGQDEHPSQALLDLLALSHFKPDLPKLKMAILGDSRHARVAHSTLILWQKMGFQPIRLIGPSEFLPEMLPQATEYAHRLTPESLADVDVILCLRIQKERRSETSAHNCFSDSAYFQSYGLTPERLAWAKPSAVFLHPGPLNRGCELDARLLSSPQSLIYAQIASGVAMRMAILLSLNNL